MNIGNSLGGRHAVANAAIKAIWCQAKNYLLSRHSILSSLVNSQTAAGSAPP
jgi:hypothetical protein